MKKILSLLVLLLAGLALGAGAGYAALTLLGPSGKPIPAVAHEEPPLFVPAQNILAPLVFPDGRLAGYVRFDVQLQVSADEVDMVTAKLPLLLHAINMRTWRTPLASGPDGLLADLEAFRRVAGDASVEAFGKNVVKRVAITGAEPA